MVLDEDALEAMIARGRKAEGQEPAEMVTTAQSDDFEVYERAKPETAEPDPPHATPEPEPVQSAPAAQPVMEPAPPEPAPVEPSISEEAAAPAPPVQAAAPTRRPEVWPPIRSHAPAPQPQPTVAASRPAGGRIAVLQATFNQELTDVMAQMASEKAAQLGASVTSHVKVPGVYDLPLAAKHLLARRDVDALVVIGVVVKGETSHDELITHATAKSLQELSLQFDKPIGFGITGPGMTWKQAEARIGNAAHAVEAALSLLAVTN